MKNTKKEPISTTNADELDNITEELPFSFDDDTNTPNIGNSTSIFPINYSTTGGVIGQLSPKYVDLGYLNSVTYDQLLAELTKEYLDIAVSAGLKDIKTIAHELLAATNRSISTMSSDKKKNTLQRLSFAQIGECLIRNHNVVNLSLDDTDDASERSTLLAVYMDYGKEEGLYHSDVSDTAIKRLINQYAFSAKMYDQKEVINYLKVHAPVKKRNSNCDLIAVRNGIFDFQRKVLIPFSPDYVFTAKLKVNYNPNAVNVHIHNSDDGTDWDFDSWLVEVADNPEIAEVLWEVISASVRPNVPFNKAVFFYSRQGNNGKGTLLELIRNLWGESNCCALSVEDFSKDFMLTSLIEASVVLGDENPVGLVLDNADQFKRCVTHDPVIINIKHVDPKNYRFRGLIIECVNEILRFKDKTGSMARRELIVPFSKSFTGAERKYIRTDYISRKEVLEYVLFRALNMNFYDFSEPQVCKEALMDQREMNDPVRQFWTELHDQFVWDLLPTEFLYELFKSWIKKNIPSCHIKGKRGFMDELADIVGEDPNWQYTGRNQVRVTKAMSDTPEPLIATYDLVDWKNPNYTGGDLSRICMPVFKDKYTGLTRR